MTKVKSRPGITGYPAMKILDKKINRIETFRTQRSKLYFWRPKYAQHILAITDNGIYEIFPPDHKSHAPLFGEME